MFLNQIQETMHQSLLFKMSKSLTFLVTLFLLVFSGNAAFGQFGDYHLLSEYFNYGDFGAADFDQDGDIDVVAVAPTQQFVNNLSRSFFIYENVDGSGEIWESHAQDLTGYFNTFEHVVVGDFNNDGFEDFIIGGGLLLYLNDGIVGEFSFTQIEVPNLPVFRRMEAGDINGDGNLDIVFASVNELNISINSGNADIFPTFITIEESSVQAEQYTDIKLTDLDTDGDLDIVLLTNHQNGLYHSTISWFENLDGNGTYGERNVLHNYVQTLPIGVPQFITIADFDINGKPDVLIDGFTGTFIIYQYDVDDFDINQIEPGFAFLSEVLAVDKDQDGDLDIVPANPKPNFRYYENIGIYNFAIKSDNESGSFDGGLFGKGLVTDIENDGIPDFLFFSGETPEIRLYELDVANDYDLKEKAKVSHNLNGEYAIKIIDLDEDGDDDVVFLPDGSNNIYWNENLDGNGTFTLPQLLIDEERITRFEFGDLDGDGDEDLLIGLINNSVFDKLWIYEKLDNNPTFAPPVEVISNTKLNPFLNLCDFDADGDLDVIFNRENTIDFLENLGGANFQDNGAILSGEIKGIGNFDGDSFPDILYENEDLEELNVFYRTSPDNGVSVLLANESSYFKFVITDIENDGDDDIVCSYFNSNEKNVRLFLNTNATFSEHILFDFGTSNEFTVFDLDGDNKKDICIRNFWYRQTDNPIDFAPIEFPPLSGGGAFPPLAMANLDEQGLPDFILGSNENVLYWRNNLIGDGYFIDGKVYLDTDEDCNFNPPVDTTLYGWVVQMENDSNSYTVSTSPFGSYSGFLPDSGAYTVNVLTPSAYWGSCVEDTIIVVDDNGVPPLNLPVRIDVECPLLGLTSNSTFLRPCIDGAVTFEYCNYGTIPAENVQLTLQPDESLIIEGSNIPWTATTDSTYIFDLPDLAALDCGQIKLFVTPDCPTVGVGDLVCIDATITPDEICLPIDSLWDESTIVASGFCVNDSVTFQLKNIGDGAMDEARQFRVEFIVNDDIVMLMQADTFQLGVNQIKEIKVPSDAQVVRIEADQDEEHPLVVEATAMVVNCSNPPMNMTVADLINQFPDEDGNPFAETFCRQLTGSYDPNEKTASPAGIGGEYIENDWELEYNIHFQNTGNDTAFTVVIRDQITENLDLSTLRVGVASHDFVWDLSMDRELTFTFSNILLPDSTTNLVESQGYVQFFIYPKKDLPVLTHIDNYADIYFDFNDPITTETVRRTIRKPVTAESEHFAVCDGDIFEEILISNDTIVVDTIFDNQEGCFLFFNHITALPTTFFVDTLMSIGDVFNGIEITQDTIFTLMETDENDCETTTFFNVQTVTATKENLSNNQVTLFPNPADDFVHLAFKNTVEAPVAIKVMDINGRKIADISLEKEPIDIRHLAAGVYFLKIEFTDKLMIKKLIVR